MVASYDRDEKPCDNSPWNEHDLAMAREPDPRSDLASLARLFHLLSRLRPSVVVAGTPKAALLMLVVSRLLRIEHRVLLLHGLRLETSSGFSRILLGQFERMTANAATRIIAVSPSLAKKYFESGYAPTEKITVLGNGSAVGIDESIFRPFRDIKNRKAVRNQMLSGFGLDPEEITFGYIGRMTEDKGISQLVDALKVMATNGLEPQCLFVGSEQGNQILEELTSLTKVRAVPWTPEIVPVYCCLDVLCLPSNREGLPTVVLEAAMMDIPTIGARSTGIVDAIQHGVTGLLVDQKDHTMLADAMTRLANETGLRKSLGKNANRYVQTYFAQADVLRRYGDFIEQMLNDAELRSSSVKRRGPK